MKKVLLYGGGVLLLLVLVFFSLGLFVPSFSYKSQVTVNAPLEFSFKVFNDTSYMKDWLPGFKRIETLEGSPNEVGSKYKLIIEEEGETYEMTETMTGFKENELFAFRLENEVLSTEVHIWFEPKSKKTTLIRANSTVTGKNLLWKSLFVLFQSTFSNNDQESYDKLKEVIEHQYGIAQTMKKDTIPPGSPSTEQDSVSTDTLKGG